MNVTQELLRRRARLLAVAALVFTAASAMSAPALAQGLQTVPANTSVSLRVETDIDARTFRVNDEWRATVLAPTVIRGVTLIPAGSTLSGRITRNDAAGVVEINIVDLRSPSGSAVTLRGDLIGSNGRTILDRTALQRGTILKMRVLAPFTVNEDFYRVPGPGVPPPPGGATPQAADAVSASVTRLLSSYSTAIGVRYDARTGRPIMTSANYRQNEIEVLFALNALATSARLYAQIVQATDDPDALRGATDLYVAQAHAVDQALARTRSPRAASTARAWQPVQADLLRLTSRR